MPARVGQYVLKPALRGEPQQGGDGAAHAGVGYGEDRDVGDVWVFGEQAGDFGCVDLLSAGVDAVLVAAEVNEVVVVEESDVVAGQQEGGSCCVDEPVGG